jgi:type I restriction enzyme S subunit
VSGLPTGWADARLEDIVSLVRGVTYKKEQAKAMAGPGLVPVIRATNVKSELKLDQDLIFVPEAAVRPEQRLQVGDIVVASSSGSISVVGKSAMLRGRWNGAFGAFCTVLRPKPGVDARYVGNYVASPTVRTRWSSLAAGTNINNLKREHFAETAVPLPPFPEQRRIVAAIEEQFSRIDASGDLVERALL